MTQGQRSDKVPTDVLLVTTLAFVWVFGQFSLLGINLEVAHRSIPSPTILIQLVLQIA